MRLVQVGSARHRGTDEFEAVGGQLTIEILSAKGDANLTFHLLD